MIFITRDALLVSFFGKETRSTFSAIFVLSSSLVSAPSFAIAKKVSRLLGRATTSLVCAGSLILLYLSLTSTTSTVPVHHSRWWWWSTTPTILSKPVIDPKYMVGAYYVCSDVCVMLLQNEFWEICNSAFKIAETKQAFGNILLGNTIANLFIGFVFVPSLKKLEITTSSRLLIVSGIAVILACMMATSTFFTRNNSSSFHQKNGDGSERSSPKSLPLSYSRIFSRSYYRHLCLFEFCATALRVFVDLQTVNVLANLLDSEAFASKLALIKGIAAVLMIPLQLGTSTILKRVGVVSGLATLPLATLIFGVGTMLLPSVIVVVVVRSIHDATGYTIFTQSRELLFLPLTPRERKVIKPLVSGTVRSIAKASGAILSILLRKIFNTNDSSATLAIMIITISLIWLIDVLSARRAYADEFYQLLHSMTGRGAVLLSERADVRHLCVTDPKVLGTVKTLLDSAAPAQKVFILESLPAHSLKPYRSTLLDLVVGRTGRRVKNGRSTKKKFKKSSRSSLSIEFDDFTNKEVNGETMATSPSRNCSRKVTMASSVPSSPSTTLETTMNISSTPPRARSATSFHEFGYASAPNSPVTRSGRRKSTQSFDENSGDGLFVKSCVSPAQQLRSQQRERQHKPKSPPPYSSPTLLKQIPGLSVAIRQKALRIMCASKITTSDDLLMLVCDPHLDPELRTEAVRMCGLYHHDTVQIRRKLDELCSSVSKSKVSDQLRASAAVSLLRITDWQHTNAHVLLYKMLHEQSNSRTRVVALRTVGTELPELISDGYLIYLLHVATPGSPLLEAAVRCCSGRRSIILLPLLFDRLSDPSLHGLVVNALTTYSEDAVLKHARQALRTAVKRLDAHNIYSAEEQVSDASLIDGCARWMTKCILKEGCVEMTRGVLKIAMIEVNTRWPNLTKKNGENMVSEYSIASSDADSCVHLACYLTLLTPLIDFLVSISPEPSALSSIQEKLLQSKNENEEMLHNFLLLIVRTIDHNIVHLSSSETTTTLHLVRLYSLLRKNVRLLMKICAIRFFPRSLSVDFLFESFISLDDERRAAAHEVLENLLSSKYREIVLPTLKRWHDADSKLLIHNNKQDNDKLSPLEVLRVLMHSPLFQNVALEDVHRVMEYDGTITQMMFPANTVFASAGEKEQEIFIVASGTVSVFVGQEIEEANENNGKEVVATLGTGACIGERRLSALFLTELTRTALRRETSARAASDCCLISVSLQKLSSMFETSPTILRGVLSVLLVDLRRCYLTRMNRQLNKGKKDNSISERESPVLDALRLSKLSTKVHCRATGLVTSRLSLLELSICLKDVRAFRHLNDKCITMLAESGEQVSFTSNESIFCEGEESTFMVIVLQGCCHLYSSSSKEPVGIVKQNYLIGELSLKDSSTRLVTLKVAKASPRGVCHVLKFSSKLFLQLMAIDKEITEAIATHVIQRIEKEKDKPRKKYGGREEKEEKREEKLSNIRWRKIRNSVTTSSGLRRRKKN